MILVVRLGQLTDIYSTLSCHWKDFLGVPAQNQWSGEMINLWTGASTYRLGNVFLGVRFPLIQILHNYVTANQRLY
jgi:hypothetical protein